VRRRRVDVRAICRARGDDRFWGGFNPAAMIAETPNPPLRGLPNGQVPPISINRCEASSRPLEAYMVLHVFAGLSVTRYGSEISLAAAPNSWRA
jgi:cytosine/uracil/thiamine/allantoin permease